MKRSAWVSVNPIPCFLSEVKGSCFCVVCVCTILHLMAAIGSEAGGQDRPDLVVAPGQDQKTRAEGHDGFPASQRTVWIDVVD